MDDVTELNICLLGDGFAKGCNDPERLGWAERLMALTQESQGDLSFFNLGIPHQRSDEVAARVSELVPRMPKGADNRLILCLGLEDTQLVGGKPVRSTQESVESLKSIIVKTRPHFKMVMVGLPPVYDPQRNMRIKRLNSYYRELCLKARVPYVDIFTALSEDVQYKRELVSTDKVLPSAKGYTKVADLIWNDRAWWFNP